MKRFPKAFLGATLLAAGFAVAPVMAQYAAPAPGPDQMPPATQAPAPIPSPAPAQIAPTNPAAQPTDEQLQKFVTASEKVSGVAEEYQPKLVSSPDDASRQQLMQEADQKMVQLVTANGLTVEEYVGISEAVQQDPQLRQRVLDLSSRSGG